MKAITLRNLPPELVRLIEKRSRQRGTGAARTIVDLLARYAGAATKGKEERTHHDLDRLSGSWTTEEAAGFLRSLTRQRRVDPGMWS